MSTRQDESASQIKSKIDPPKLKWNIVLNVLNGEGNPNIKLRPFIKYAKDTLVDKILGYRDKQRMMKL